MFKMFSTMTMFGLLTVSAADGQTNQTVNADIPFAFMVQNTTLAAGHYRLTYNKNLQVLCVQGSDQNSHGAIALPYHETVRGSGPSKLVFECYDRSCWLDQVWDGAADARLELPSTDRQRRLAFITRALPFTIPTK